MHLGAAGLRENPRLGRGGRRIRPFDHRIYRDELRRLIGDRHIETVAREPVARRHLAVDVDQPTRPVGIAEPHQHSGEIRGFGLPHQGGAAWQDPVKELDGSSDKAITMIKPIAAA